MQRQSSVFQELNWRQPERIIDLYVECKNFSNGLIMGKGVFSLESMAKKYNCETNYLADDKTNLRERLGQNKVTVSEIENVKRYNIEDVLVTERLFNFWEKAYDRIYQGGIVWLQALERGQHARVAAEAGRNGYPVDTNAWDKFLNKYDEILDGVVTNANTITGCFPKGKFNSIKFAKLIHKHNLQSNWPQTAKGAFQSDQETLRSVEDIEDFKILKDALYLRGATKLRDVPIDPKDGRSKTMFSLFGAKTGRTTPSTSKHIPNMAGCFRPFIKAKGAAIMTVDYEQQEFAIAAILSNDDAMLTAYESGDPYLALGKMSGIIPKDADKNHPMRERFKVYQTSNGWSYKLPPGSTFRTWGETEGYSENTLRNWIVQAEGCEVLRRAMVKVSDDGFAILGLMHDELIIEHPMIQEEPEFVQSKVRELMEEASYEVLGWRIKTEAKIILPGERLYVKHPKDFELFKFFAEKAGFDV